MSVIVRFAPSPTGRLHVGNVRAALWNWLFSRKSGGQFMLRIDDTDRTRSTAAFEEGIHADLAWLGLSHDLTAKQSERFYLYSDIADQLRGEGLLYPCYETPEELDRKRKLQRARGLPPVYDRAALGLSASDRASLEADGRKPHWRYRLAQKPVRWDDLIRGETVVDTASVSDPILVREDGQYLYTLPSCIDDVDFAISHVIRGEDHVTNAAVQVEIMEKLIAMGRGKGGGLPRFAHHSLLIGADGAGLSKRLGSLSIEAMRAEGLEPAAITSLLAKLGTADPVEACADLHRLADEFDFARMGRAPARFDMNDLWALNARLIQQMDWEDVHDRLAGTGVTEALWMAIRDNISRVGEAEDWVNIVAGEIKPEIEDPAFTTKAATCLPSGPYTEASWSDFTEAVKAETGAKGKGLFMPLRLALTGRRQGPDMTSLFALIGEEKARARLSGQTA